MKKIVNAVLIITLVLVTALAGCNNTPERTTVKKVAKEPEQWVLENDGTFSSCAYGVTDLDQNGLLEIIADYTDKDTKLVVTKFYVVDEEGIVSQCKHEPAGEKFESAYFDEDVRYGTACYYDAATGEYFYTYTRLTRVEKPELHEQIVAFSLKGDVVTEELLATKVELYDVETDQEIYTYKDAAGNEIDEEAFENAAKNRFAGLEEKKVSFGGFRAFTTSENEVIKAMSQKEVEEILMTSYSKFVIS